MSKRVITTATYAGNAHDIFRSALMFSELSGAMSGLARYEGLPDHPVKTGDTYIVNITVWKVFKTKNYEIYIADLDEDACLLKSQEKGGAITRWEHNLSVRQEGEFAVWTDDVTFNAGVLTPFMAHFCAYMYKRRHKYRKALSIKTDMRSAPS